MSEVVYRLEQALLILTAFLRKVDMESVEAVLSPELTRLFLRMRRSEQLHSIQVMKDLQAGGHDDPHLLTSALLHDVGKSRYPFTFFDRVLIVLVEKFWAERALEWGQGEPKGWPRPFVIRTQHPRWSAEDMQSAGASPESVWLALHHQEKSVEGATAEQLEQLRQLQAVDDMN